MTPIRTNKPLFFNSVGEPLNGTIWIGQPDKDPRTNPKTVTFRDAGGAEFAASQPLATINGRISYNGKPIIALVESNFSLLSFDSSGAQVEYSKDIEPDGAEAEADGFTQLIRVGLTLAEIKAFDVAVGETIKNVGKILATDDLGAEWLVISATGSPADDIDLIDFSNGLQGRRSKTFVYRRDIIESGTFILDDPATIVNTPDANSYRNVWTNIDLSSQVPAEATSAIVRVSVDTGYGSAGVASRLSVLANARKTGSSVSAGDSNRIGQGYSLTNTNDVLTVGFSSEVTVPLDFNVASSFELYLVVNDPTVSANNTTPDLTVTVVGYTINAKDFL